MGVPFFGTGLFVAVPSDLVQDVAGVIDDESALPGGVVLDYSAIVVGGGVLFHVDGPAVALENLRSLLSSRRGVLVTRDCWPPVRTVCDSALSKNFPSAL